MEKLLAHAQSMLSETEQGLARSSGRVKTEGDVKLTLFFQLFWKEKFASHSRDLHELYLLVRCADLLCGEDHGVRKWPPKAETGRRPTFGSRDARLGLETRQTCGEVGTGPKGDYPMKRTRQRAGRQGLVEDFGQRKGPKEGEDESR